MAEAFVAERPCFLFLFQVLLIINFSSRTTSMDIQRNLEANVEKRTKETYGPPMGKRLLVFMDDMNMPRVRSQTVCKGNPEEVGVRSSWCESRTAEGEQRGFIDRQGTSECKDCCSGSGQGLCSSSILFPTTVTS